MAIHRSHASSGHRSDASTARFRQVKIVSGLLAATLAIGLVASPAAQAVPRAAIAAVAAAPSPPAAASPASPAEPTKSADAKKAWLAAADDADALNELVLESQEKEKAATAAAKKTAGTLSAKQTAAADAQNALTAANAAAATAQTQLRKAAASNATYQAKVDSFTNASFRGAHFGSLSAMLTSDSPDDFLDTASTLNAVADDTHQTLIDAAAAKTAAKTAQTAADTAAASAKTAAAGADAAVAAAADAKKQADSARAAAHLATRDVTKRQQRLKTEAAKMNKLYNALSEKERQEAVAAQEKANEEAAAKAAVVAAANQAADRSRRDAINNAANASPSTDNASPSTDNASPSTDNARPSTDNASPPTDNASPSTDNGSPSAAADKGSAPSAAAQASGKAAIAVQAALSKEGDPYVFGASGPNAFDCSGLTSWAWAQAGVSIPRTSADQANLPYVPLDQLQPGDLITYYSPVHHVAMYIGNGQIINASTESKPVSVMSMYYNGQNPTGHRVG